MNGPFKERELDEEEEDDWRAGLAQRKAMVDSNSALGSFLRNFKLEIMGRMVKKGYGDTDIAEILELNEEEFTKMKKDL